MSNKKLKNKYALGYNYAQNVDTSDMPDNIHYFLVLPISASRARHQKYYKSTIPVILTYQHDNMTFNELLDQFKRQKQLYKHRNISFTTQKYENINHDLTVKLYKALINNKNINGMILCLHQVGEQKQVLPFYINECSVNDYNKKFQKENKLNLRCQIPIKDPLIITNKDGKLLTKYQQKKVYIFVDIPLAASGWNLKDQLMKKLNLEFQKNLKIQQIQSVTIDGKIKLDQKQTLNAQFITNDSRIVLNLQDNQIKLTKKRNLNCKRQLIIFKEGAQDSQLFQYEQVWHMTFQQLYQLYLKLKDSEQKVDALYCLKIMDLIILPEDSMDKIDHYFAYLQEAIPAIFVGKVINQKMLFYKMIPEISLNKPFSVNQLTIPEQYRPKRQQLRQIVRSKAKNARHIPLKRQQNLEPIMLYTSELKYIDQQNQQKLVYASLNSFLRNSRVLSLQSKDYLIDWRFRYSSILLRQLQHIQRFKGKVYRGLNYDPKASVGNVLTFKQFTSTSKQYEKAKFFADKKQGPERIIYQIQIESGFPIKQYSHYPSEDEVLLQPFTDFQVTKIQNKPTADINYKIYHLKQIRTAKQFPIVCANFIIWIDNTVNEGRKIFEYLAFSQTTLLIQLKSTRELKKWLEDHKDLLNDKTANIVFLTNMTRKQENGVDEYAGANAIKELRKYSQSVPVCVYIGNLPLANKKLAQSNISKINVLVTADSNEVTSFLLDQLINNNK